MFVESMLQIHAKYTELIKDIFQNDSEFSSALDKACSIAINHRPNLKTSCRSPELVGYKTINVYIKFVYLMIFMKKSWPNIAIICCASRRKSSPRTRSTISCWVASLYLSTSMTRITFRSSIGKCLPSGSLIHFRFQCTLRRTWSIDYE